MSKSERLFQLLTLLRAKRFAVTAKQLAEQMQVSERTIYRDIRSLQLSGVPLEGEAGVGYILKPGSHLQPLMFTQEELVAIQLGIRMVQAWTDKELAGAAGSALTKIQSILPDKLKQQIEELPLLVPDYHIQSATAELSFQLRKAVDAKREVALEYQREDGQQSSRIIQPLGLVFWGKTWTLAAWCGLRNDYRNFRVDRILSLKVSDTCFETHASKSLQHYMAQYKQT